MNRPHQDFLHAVHRRLALTRILENLGLCALAGCVIALPLVALLWWREQSPLILLAAVGCVVIPAALVMTIYRWPTLFAAAAEADRQLDLHDLLTTTIQSTGETTANDLMIAPVLAMADARCRQISPSAVMVNRLGVRAWGGIALSLCAVLAVLLLPSHPLRSAQAVDDLSGLKNVTQSQAAPMMAQNAAISAKNQADGPSGEDSRPLMSRQVNHETPGVGTSSASSDMSISAPISNPLNANSADGKTGAIAGGGIGPAPTKAGTPPTGFAATPSQSQIPAWQTNTSPPDDHNQSADLTNNKIPPADRDLIRAYFTRD